MDCGIKEKYIRETVLYRYSESNRLFTKKYNLGTKKSLDITPTKVVVHFIVKYNQLSPKKIMVNNKKYCSHQRLTTSKRMLSSEEIH